MSDVRRAKDVSSIFVSQVGAIGSSREVLSTLSVKVQRTLRLHLREDDEWHRLCTFPAHRTVTRVVFGSLDRRHYERSPRFRTDASDSRRLLSLHEISPNYLYYSLIIYQFWMLSSARFFFFKEMAAIGHPFLLFFTHRLHSLVHLTPRRCTWNVAACLCRPDTGEENANQMEKIDRSITG